jgi:hypothetical protein
MLDEKALRRPTFSPRREVTLTHGQGQTLLSGTGGEREHFTADVRGQVGSAFWTSNEGSTRRRTAMSHKGRCRTQRETRNSPLRLLAKAYARHDLTY